MFKKDIFIFMLLLITLSLYPQQNQIKREVKISYKLNRISKLGSNQLAIWIEDESGNIIKTLFVTRFTSTGGYKKRAQALRSWVRKYNLSARSQKEIDAITSATQRAGIHTIVWDCKDENGTPVKDGKYYYIIEGNIYFDNIVNARGEIIVGRQKNSTRASIIYMPENARNHGILIENVTATFE